MERTPATDVIARLHGLYQKKRPANHDQLPALRLKPLPPPVVDALATHDLDFDTLPRALQHALLWEAGYSTTSDEQVVGFATRCGFTTADALAFSSLALPTCAISLPTSDPNVKTAWLWFSQLSVLPSLPTSFGDQKTSSSASNVFIPCATTLDESFCTPSPSKSLASFLSAYIHDQAATISYKEKDFAHSALSVVQRRLDTANTSTGTGLISDFTTALYALRAAGATLPRLEIRTGVPNDVLARLDAFHLPFKSLTGLLQRAVLWDSGYAVVKFPDDSSSIVDVVPVYVKCGLRMANIAPDRAYFETTRCSVQDCSIYNRSVGETLHSLRARDCPMTTDGKTLSTAGSTLLALSRCAVPSSVDALDIPVAATTTVWALGNISTSETSAVPRLRLQQHPSSTATTKWYAIHSVPTEVSLGACPPLPSFIIPCVTVDQTNLHQEWCRPVHSELISTWMRQEQHQEMALATLILMAGAILIALALDLFADRKPRLFGTARVSASSMPSLTSSLFDTPGNGDQQGQDHDDNASDATGWSSVRSAESVRSDR